MQFLFVGDFLHEAIPGYFVDDAAVVEELGAQACTLFPPSGKAVEDGADLVREETLRRFASNARPVVLVGHSKGGAEALLAVLRYPELITTGVVDRVIVIQGAIGGSPVADRLAGAGAARSSPLRFAGLEALTRAHSRAVFQDELAALRTRVPPEVVAWISSRVFSVRARGSGCWTRTTPRSPSPACSATARPSSGAPSPAPCCARCSAPGRPESWSPEESAHSVQPET